MASSGPAVTDPVVSAAAATEPMAPASPEPKRPRQRDAIASVAMTRDVTLPQLVAEFAEIHSRSGRDEVFVTGMHDAVDHNAMLFGAVL